MRKILLSFMAIFIAVVDMKAQDTFSIVAVDSATGEVGSAGASCVDLPLVAPSFSTDFLGELLPGLAAINTQAFYIQQNQINARNQMLLGRTPSEAITWLELNDAQGNSTIRQYGIAALVNGSPEAAAFTGSQTNAYTGQRVGDNYAIQGNILLGPEILDSMESRFLNSPGDLRCKLMAAMQGANVVGADTRCAVYGTSSLFAFLKVALPTDTFGSPTHLISVRTSSSDGIEPVDSLQVLFDQNFPNACDVTSNIAFFQSTELSIYPIPAENTIFLKGRIPNVIEYKILSIQGRELERGIVNNRKIDISDLAKGTYIISLFDGNNMINKALHKF